MALLTLDDAAGVTGLRRQQLRSLALSGAIPYRRIAKPGARRARIYFTEQDIQEWIEHSRVAVPGRDAKAC